MAAQREEFERFVRRVHRRFVALRLLEGTGLGVLAGSAAALPLLGIMVWQGAGSAAAQLAMAALSIGALAGALWGIGRRPSTLAAAIEADRQLQAADLLSSAMAVRDDHTSAWTGAVISAANAMCARVAPSSVVLRRLGARAWGGIALAAVLVLVLGLLPNYASIGRAEDRQVSWADNSPGARQREADRQEMAGQSRVRNRVQQDPDSEVNRGGDENSEDPDTRNSSDANAGTQKHTSADSSGHGTGASHSDTHTPNHPDAGSQGTHSKATSQGGQAASGVGESNQNPSPTADSNHSTAAGSAKSARPIPPWRASSWPTNVERARRELDSGQIPDTYRDIVRAYFDRP